MIKTLIIDDEEKAIVVLKRLLKKYCPEVNVVGDADEVEKAVELIESHHPDLLFLDIEMPGESGFDLLERIQGIGRNFHVIFVTAHGEFALKAFRFSVTDYLLKPVSIDLLMEAVQKVKRLVDASKSETPGSKKDEAANLQTLRIPSTNGLAFVHINNIIRMEADGAYTHIYLDHGKHYMSSYHLKQFEEHLDPAVFIRAHRSHLINLDKIKSIQQKDGIFVEMTDGSRIEIPRRSKESFIKIVQLR